MLEGPTKEELAALSQYDSFSKELKAFMERMCYPKLDAIIGGWTILHHAVDLTVREPDLRMVVDELLTHVSSEFVNLRIRSDAERAPGWTVMHIVASGKDPSGIRGHVVNSLVAARASIDATRDREMTPLLMAASTANLLVVQALLEARANPHLASSKGATAFDFAWNNAGVQEVFKRLKVSKGTGTEGKGEGRCQ